MFDNLMIFCLCLQDRSLDFHELCALYAVTGKICVLKYIIPTLSNIFMTSFYRQCIKIYCWYSVLVILSFLLTVFIPIIYADVALVTSLRDGMNLVSYEFVACQEKKKGVLILSEVISNTYYHFNLFKIFNSNHVKVRICIFFSCN